MYNHIDRIIFPNWCEVYQTASHQYVYPIFKNGTNSLKVSQLKNNWKILINEQLKKLDTIVVFWRPAFERYISGVNSVIQFELRDNTHLDVNTIKFFIKKYPFLDRHYCPQYFWLINLMKYTKCKVLIKPLSKINDIVDINLKPGQPWPDGLHVHQKSQGTKLQEPINTKLLEEFDYMKDNDYLKIDDKIFETYVEQPTQIEEIEKIWNALG